MTYAEYDKKYNYRRRGIIERCSIINLEGKIIYQGEIEDVEEYWDNNTEPVYENGIYTKSTLDGQEVVMTNVNRSGRYSDYFFNKLLFKVAR